MLAQPTCLHCWLLLAAEKDVPVGGKLQNTAARSHNCDMNSLQEQLE